MYRHTTLALASVLFAVQLLVPGAAAAQSAQPREGRPELMSPSDRDQFRERMRNAQTPEERARVRQEMRATLEQRAKEKGVELPKRGPRGPGESTGDKAPGGAQRGAMMKLLTPQERDQFREKMQSAQTPEDRRRVRQELRGTIEQRAREKGVSLPERSRRRDAKTGPNGQTAPAK